MADTGIPPLLLIAAWVGVAGVFVTFFYPFFLTDPPLIAILFSVPATILSLYCLFKILLLHFWALLIYILLFISNQAILLMTGIWSVYTIIVPPMVITVALLFWRDFE